MASRGRGRDEGGKQAALPGLAPAVAERKKQDRRAVAAEATRAAKKKPPAKKRRRARATAPERLAPKKPARRKRTAPPRVMRALGDGPRLDAGAARHKEGRWFVQRTTIQGFERKEGELEIRPFVTNPAYVGVRYASTIRTNDFESQRVEVSILLPCYPEEIDDASKQAEAWAGHRITEERAEIMRAFGVAGRMGPGDPLQATVDALANKVAELEARLTPDAAS